MNLRKNQEYKAKIKNNNIKIFVKALRFFIINQKLYFKNEQILQTCMDVLLVTIFAFRFE